MAETTFDILFRAKNLDEIGNNLDKAIRDKSRGISRTVSDAISKGAQIASVDPRIASSFDTMFQKPLQRLKTDYVKALAAGNKEAAGAIKDQIDLHVKGVDEEFKARKKAFDEMRRMQERSQKGQEKFLNRAQRGEGAVGTLTSAVGSGDFGGLLRNLLQSGQGAAQRRQGTLAERAQAAQASGTLQGAQQAASLGKVAGTLGKVATALGAVAAVAGSIALLVKLFIDLDSRVKDMNKAILSTASAADFGFGYGEVMAGKLGAAVDQVRQETVASALELGVKAQDLQGALTAFNEAGYTFDRMQTAIADTGNTINDFGDVAGMAVTQSRMLGMSVQETAQVMGQFAVDTGSSLEDISMQFSQITREAQAAGVSTKRFFQTISEATSGMAFYGVRIEETARILSNFDSLLGETVGTDLFKQLTGKGKDMGAQQRLQEIILKNPEQVAEAYASTFESRQAELARDFGDQLRDVGLNADDILQMDEQEIRNRLVGVLNPQEIERFTQASVIRQAGAGNLAAQQRARAFGGTGLDIRLAASATEAFGGKRIDEVFRDIAADPESKGQEFAALEQVTGKSFDELEKLSSLFSNANANLTKLEDIASKEKSARSDEDRAFLKAQEEMFGITLGDNGQIKRGDKVIADAVDFVAETQAKTEEELSKALSQDQQVAMKVRDTVTSISDQIEMVIAQILENIYDVVVDIYQKMLGSDRDAVKRSQNEDAARQKELELNKELTSGQNRLTDLQQQQEAARSEGDMDLVSALEADKQAQIASNEAVAKKIEINNAIAKEQNEGLKARSRAEIAAERGLLSMQAAQAIEGIGIDQTDMTFAEAVSRRGEGGFRDLLASAGAADISADVMGNRQFLASLGQGNIRGAFRGGSAADLARQTFVQDESLLKQVGGEQALLDLIAQAEQSASETDAVKSIGLLTSSREATKIRTDAFQTAFQNALTNLGIDESVKKTAENTKEDPFSPGSFLGNAAALFGTPRKASDLIIPAGGGSPIITDSADTIMATKPGGAIDRASSRGGRGGGNVVVNIYGGDERKVYNTIMKVMRETGNV